jgi:predicted kinase
VDLILINGAPGVGKSTVAELLVDRMPLALNLDIDLVRRQLGRWRETQGEANVAARDLAIAMASTHLASGRSVVVAQYLGRPEFLGRLEQTAAAGGARFVEIVLTADVDTLADRFHSRTIAAAHPSHVEIAAMVDDGPSGETPVELHARLTSLLAHRPNAVLVSTEGRTADEVCVDVLAVMGS